MRTSSINPVGIDGEQKFSSIVLVGIYFLQKLRRGRREVAEVEGREGKEWVNEPNEDFAKKEKNDFAIKSLEGNNKKRSIELVIN